MKLILKRTSLSVLALAAGLLIPAQAHADGFYTQQQSVKASGRAFSGEVADRGAESLWWNPAAIGGLAQRSAYIGAAWVEPSGDVNDRGTLILRPNQTPVSVEGQAYAQDPTDGGVLPSAAVAFPLSDRVAVGVAITSPFNVTTEYGADSWTRYTSVKTKIAVTDIQPSIGFQMTSWLRAGVGLNIEHVESERTGKLPNLVSGAPDGDQTLEGSGWDFGWSTGVQAEHRGLVVGLSYKSAIEHNLDGSLTISGLLDPLASANLQVQGTSRFTTPWQTALGLRAAVSPKTTLNAQVVRYGWSEFDAVRLGAPVNAALPQNYRDTWSLAAGADYSVDAVWTVRGGVQYAQTPTRDGWRDSAVPDADRWTVAVGVSRFVASFLTFDAALSYVDADGVRIDRQDAAFAGTPLQTPILVAGELTGGRALILAVGARLNF